MGSSQICAGTWTRAEGSFRSDQCLDMRNNGLATDMVSFGVLRKLRVILGAPIPRIVVFYIRSNLFMETAIPSGDPFSRPVQASVLRGSRIHGGWQIVETSTQVSRSPFNNFIPSLVAWSPPPGKNTTGFPLKSLLRVLLAGSVLSGGPIGTCRVKVWKAWRSLLRLWVQKQLYQASGSAVATQIL